MNKFLIVLMGFCFLGYDVNGGDLLLCKECVLCWCVIVMVVMLQIELILVVGYYVQSWYFGVYVWENMIEMVCYWCDYFELIIGVLVLLLLYLSWCNIGWIKKNLWFEKELLLVLKEFVYCKID